MIFLVIFVDTDDVVVDVVVVVVVVVVDIGIVVIFGALIVSFGQGYSSEPSRQSVTPSQTLDIVVTFVPSLH